MFYDRHVVVRKVCKAENLIWEHLHYSACNRCCRSTMVNMLAFVMIYYAFIMMIILKNRQEENDVGAGLLTNCPNDPVDVQTALDDWDKPTM